MEVPCQDYQAFRKTFTRNTLCFRRIFSSAPLKLNVVISGTIFSNTIADINTTTTTTTRYYAFFKDNLYNVKLFMKGTTSLIRYKLS